MKLDQALGEGELLRLAEDEVGAQAVDALGRRRLQHAARQRDGGAGGKPPGDVHEVRRLAVRGVGHRAGVDDDGVGVRLDALGDAPAGLAQTPRHRLGVGDVQLAAEGEDGGGRRTRRNVGHK